MSSRDSRDELCASPDRARSLLTVRAAISSARPSELPRSSSPSLMCSYWRARLVPFFTPRGGISSPSLLSLPSSEDEDERQDDEQDHQHGSDPDVHAVLLSGACAPCRTTVFPARPRANPAGGGESRLPRAPLGKGRWTSRDGRSGRWVAREHVSRSSRRRASSGSSSSSSVTPSGRPVTTPSSCR